MILVAHGWPLFVPELVSTRLRYKKKKNVTTNNNSRKEKRDCLIYIYKKLKGLGNR